MKDKFTIIETIRIAYLAARECDDSFINCLYHCLEIRKYYNEYLKAGGTIEEIRKIFLKAEEDCN